MKKLDYANFIEDFESKLKEDCLTIKNSYDSQTERQEIYKLCRKFARAYVPPAKGLNERVKEEALRPYFLRSLTVFDSDVISDYFAEKTQGLQILRRDRTSDGIELGYVEDRDKTCRYKIFVPRTGLTMNDQIGYAHEMGHIPEIDVLRESYLEYGEVLPMFMEFVIHLRRFPEFQKAFDNFLFVRLPMEQEVARDILKICKNANNSNPIVAKQQRLLLADWYSFLESLEYAIQLIARCEDDMAAVIEELEKVLDGKSLIAVARDLDIETEECPMLQQECKRIRLL